MAKKEFTYRGKKVSELQSLSLKELAGFMPSAVRRRIKRGLTEQQKILLERIKSGGQNIKTHCRDMPILPEMVDKTLRIYNGKEFVLVTIQNEMIGHYLGEFSQTRRKVGHSAPGVGATKSSAHASVR